MYLSSFRIGNHPDELLTLLGEGRRTALILNAQDYKRPSDRATDVAQESERLQSIGLQPEEVDLRTFFGKQDELKKRLADFDLLWVRGGNVFVLRRAFKQSGADVVIPELLKQDVIMYGGYSAGTCIMQPDLHGIELVDDPQVVPEGYDKKVIWECLGLLPFGVAPHYKSEHPESHFIDKVVEYYIENHIPFVALHDGEAIVIKNGQTRFLG